MVEQPALEPPQVGHWSDASSLERQGALSPSIAWSNMMAPAVILTFPLTLMKLVLIGSAIQMTIQRRSKYCTMHNVDSKSAPGRPLCNSDHDNLQTTTYGNSQTYTYLKRNTLHDAMSCYN